MEETKNPSAKPFALRARPRGLPRWIPIIQTLRDYKREWLIHDITAGLVLTAILVPVGMAYAAASGLPAIYGLYATIIPLIAYAVFGPSKILVLGPDSALAGLIAATILPLAAGNTDKAIALAGMLAILTGALCILAGLVKFGFITDLLAKPIRIGYLNGIALTVLIGQLPKVFGFSVSGSNFLQETNGLIQGIWNGQINWTACVIGLSCLAVILGFRRWAPKIPGVLIAVAGATIIASVLDLSVTSGIAVVGPLPQGLPQFQIPALSFAEFNTLFAAAVAIALVSFADMSTLSRTFALRAGQEVDSNQEIIALGAANMAAGFFQGFPVTSSASRTPVAESAGAKTQITGLVGAVCIALLLIFAPNLLQNLPQAALGAVVICACISLVEVRPVVRLYKLRREEFIFSIACFLGVVSLDVIKGIFIAIALALLAFIWRAWHPYDAVLGHVEGLNSYHDISRHPEARLIPGLVLFRWDAPLFFANAETFREQLLRAVAHAPTPTRWVVVTAEPMTDVDTTAADVLAELDNALHQAGMDLFFAEMKGPVKDMLKRYGLFTRLGVDNFFPTIEQAVERYLAVHKIDWPGSK
ncbi:MAG: SulP family inorganic anion transporter [Deltaproteobacteria bacterium]|nr:SulP family inorganic anion transporter [Deltaproteobacteria bacterium]